VDRAGVQKKGGGIRGIRGPSSEGGCFRRATDKPGHTLSQKVGRGAWESVGEVPCSRLSDKGALRLGIS